MKVKDVVLKIRQGRLGIKVKLLSSATSPPVLETTISDFLSEDAPLYIQKYKIKTVDSFFAKNGVYFIVIK